MKTLDYLKERIMLQVFVVLAWVTTYVLSLPSSINVDYASFQPVLVISTFLYFLAGICIWRDIRYIGIGSEVLAAGVMMMIPILISTYLAISLNMPLADKELIVMDDALGFNWFELIHLVNTTPWLENILSKAYSSFAFQLSLIPILLVAFGKVKRACAFVAAYGLLCFISSLIAIWYPALGTFTMYGVSQADVPNIKAVFGFLFLEDFNAVRTGAEFTLRLDGASGIITFPSVHAAVACLCIWAMWENIYARFPFLILNLFMNLSAITHANHYLVDIIAGAGIAALTVAVVTPIFMGYRMVGFKPNLSHAQPMAS
ncbi:MAG: phosphatase PAP2 family protein [Salaquimonas sp.]